MLRLVDVRRQRRQGDGGGYGNGSDVLMAVSAMEGNGRERRGARLDLDGAVGLSPCPGRQASRRWPGCVVVRAWHTRSVLLAR